MCLFSTLESRETPGFLREHPSIPAAPTAFCPRGGPQGQEPGHPGTPAPQTRPRGLFQHISPAAPSQEVFATNTNLIWITGGLVTPVPAAWCHEVSHKTQGYHGYQDNLIDLAVHQGMSCSTAKTKGPEHLQASGVLSEVCQEQAGDAFFGSSPTSHRVCAQRTCTSPKHRQSKPGCC